MPFAAASTGSDPSRRAAAPNKSATAGPATQKAPPPPPPPPPQGRRSVAHLVTQLQGQMAHHTGYVPQGGVLMALHYHQRQAHPQSNQKKSAELPERRSFWSRWCRRGNDSSGNGPNDQGVTVRLLDESEW